MIIFFEVGKISKQWTGVMKEAFTDADNFGVNFPVDLDVKVKAIDRRWEEYTAHELISD